MAWHTGSFGVQLHSRCIGQGARGMLTLAVLQLQTTQPQQQVMRLLQVSRGGTETRFRVKVQSWDNMGLPAAAGGSSCGLQNPPWLPGFMLRPQPLSSPSCFTSAGPPFQARPAAPVCLLCLS